MVVLGAFFGFVIGYIVRAIRDVRAINELGRGMRELCLQSSDPDLRAAAEISLQRGDFK